MPEHTTAAQTVHIASTAPAAQTARFGRTSVLAASSSFQLWRTNNQVQRELRAALRPFDLKYPEFIVLTMLVSDMQWSSMRQQQFKFYTEISKMTLSNIVRSLQRKGLVRRTRSFIDGRSYSVRATAPGANLVRQAAAAVQAVDRHLEYARIK